MYESKGAVFTARCIMHDLHIIDFCKDTAKTFIMLYKQFPVKTTLFVEDVAGPDVPDEFGLHSPRHNACFSTFIWLAESGYINYSQTIRQEAIEQAVLTHKAFTYFTAKSDQALKTRIFELNETLTTQSSETLKNHVLHHLLATPNTVNNIHN